MLLKMVFIHSRAALGFKAVCPSSKLMLLMTFFVYLCLVIILLPVMTFSLTLVTRLYSVFLMSIYVLIVSFKIIWVFFLFDYPYPETATTFYLYFYCSSTNPN